MIDHYVIRSVLGAGGFGITYLARHELLGRHYAIKEYIPDEFSYRQGQSVRSTSHSEPTYRWGLERFLAEARALARFKHPSIVNVVSVFEANETAYMVLDYERGRDLGTWLKELGRPPTQGETDKIVLALLSALEAVHEHGLLHRDVAPDNILIRDDGSPVLIDFGSARESVRGRSKVMSAIVKRGYSPPEQYTSRPELQGPWSDIYALAATIYRMLSGEVPADATDRMLEDALPPLASRVRGIYRLAFIRAIEHGLRLQSRDRPQSVRAWRDELFSIEDEGVASPIEGAAAPVRAGSVFSGDVPASPLSVAQPDLSWLHAEGAEAAVPQPVPWYRSRRGRQAYYAVLGALGGAVAGALSSIVFASIVAVNCSADSCVAAYLPACSIVGALVGAVVGVKISSMTQHVEPSIDDLSRDGLL